MKERLRPKDNAVASIRSRSGPKSKAGIRGFYHVVCKDKDGNIKWEDYCENNFVNTGLDYVIDVAFGGAGEQTQIHPTYLGLTDGTPTVQAGDTMASHTGWNEVTAYTEGTREEFVDVSTGGAGQRDNSASVASYAINGTTTVGGIFCTSDNTKSGTSGTLISAVAFTGGDRSLVNLDTLEVTYTVSVADS